MVGNKEQYVRFRDIFPSDAYNEARLARKENTLFNKKLPEFERLVEENEEIDGSYKSMLFCFLTMKDRFEPHKKRKDRGYVDDCSSEEEYDPQYDLYLKHLKEHYKPYGLEYEIDSSPVVDEYERDIVSVKVCDPQPRRQSSIVMRQNEVKRLENVKASPKDKMLDRECQIVKIEDNHYVYKHKGNRVVSKKIYGVNDQKKERPRKLSGATRQKRRHQGKHGPQCKKNKAKAPTNMQVRNIEADKVWDMISLPNDKMSDLEHLHHHQIVKVEDDYYVVNEKTFGVNNHEKEGEDEVVSDVEVLESSAYLKLGTLSSFVPSKIYHESMEEDDLQHVGRSSASDEFRERVLDFLRQPFNKEEYKWRQEAVRAGSYLDYYPGLGKALKSYRYKKGKRLTILRGFFFWLQNLTQEGAFKPWTDHECLAVEPGPP